MSEHVSTNEVASPATAKMILVMEWIDNFGPENAFVAIRLANAMGASESTIRGMFARALKDAPAEIRALEVEAWALAAQEAEENTQ